MSSKSEAIEGLVGQYCPLCVASMRSYLIAAHSIVPLCREDLDKILHNGDMARITKMLQAKETSTTGDNLDGRDYFKEKK